MLVVGANLAVDRTLRMPRLHPGSVQRPRSVQAGAGGKAINVCRAAAAHGVRPTLVANLPGQLGAIVGDWLDAEGHDVIRVPTAGEIRSAVIILEDDLRTTVLNEPGPDLSIEGRAALLSAIERAAQREAQTDGVLVASGSLPPGPGSMSFYADVVHIAHQAGLVVVLDAARDALLEALPTRPDFITPNLSEALAVLGHATLTESVEPDFDDPPRVAQEAAAALLDRGAGCALVTAGRYGVAVAMPGQVSWLKAPSIDEVNAIGAGDAFAAGLACGLGAGESLLEAAARAVATGAASVASPVAGDVDRNVLDQLLSAASLSPLGARR